MVKKLIKGITFTAGMWPLNSGKPTLIFIHGAGNTKILWKNQVNELSDCANTIAIDLPGHGESPGDGKRRIEDYASVVEDFIKEIDAPKPVVCGLSMGGAVSLQLLVNDSGNYRAGVLMNTGAKLKVAPGVFGAIKDDYSRFVSMIETFAVSDKTDIEKIESLIKDIKKCSPDTVYGDFEACNNFNLMDRLDSINVPVLIITGRDDKLTPAKYGIYLNDNISDSRIVNIIDCGHLSPLEKPEEVNPAIRKFIGEIDPN